MNNKTIGMTVLAMALLASQALAQEQPTETVEPFGHDAWFEADPEPKPAAVDGNPLDYAGKRIGMPYRRLSLPRGWESSYRFGARFPLVDAVMNRPLYMKTWAENAADRIRDAHRARPFRALDPALAFLQGYEAPEETEEAPRTAAEDEARRLFRERLETAALTDGARNALADLFDGFLAARALVSRALEDVPAEDLAFFDENPGYYIAPDGEKMPSLTGDVETHFRFIGKARAVHFERLFLAARRLASALGAYVERMEALGKAGVFEDPSGADACIRLDTPAGAVVIAGRGDDVHEADAAFLVDLGGRDVFRNNAGASAGPGSRVALCVDHGGNDRYEAASRRYVQGFGFLGVGFLADLGGDDRYEARHVCQGAGILGVGALWDRAGDDRYVAHAFCQGAGAFGLGALFDAAGEDVFDGATLCQGGATTLGIGLLSDLEGDDRYRLKIGPDKDALGNLAGYGQGGALSFRPMPWRGRLTPYGGAGLLFDAAGNDRYRSGGWCDQGGSYILSLGALVDDAGNDHYSCHTGQGSGIHITAAILVDRDGHDVYEGGFRAGGSGGDRSPGFLIDYRGCDVYRSRTSSYGTGCKPFSGSLLIDYEGEDTYICPRPEGEITFNNWDSFGGVWPESEPHLWPYAICLDLGGRDDYRVRNRKNDSERHSFGHGIHLDMEWKGGDVIGEVASPLPGYGEAVLPGGVSDLPCGKDVEALLHPDTFVRFQATGRILEAGWGALPALAKALETSEHVTFNRDALECIHALLARGNVPEDVGPHLKGLMHAADPEVRTVVCDDIAVWPMPEMEETLIEVMMTDEVAAVRRAACGALAALRSAEGRPLAEIVAERDPDALVRREAVRYASRVQGGTDPFDLLVKKLEQDASPVVRHAAAEGLAGLHRPEALEVLRRASSSKDVYVRRAAAKGMAELGEKEGIRILIASLAFPSIDAFHNYNRNVPNTIASLCGHDLPEDRRYDRRAWMAWFEANRDGIDAKKNAEAHRAYQELKRAIRGLPYPKRVGPLEAFLEKHPDFFRAKKTLAGTLNALAWEKVTAPAGSPKRNPEQGLALAKRAVELAPDPNYVDTLAEAHFAMGDLQEAERICREMLEKKPGWRMFADRLKRCREAAQEGEGRAWRRLDGDALETVHYRPGLEADASEVRRWTDLARAALKEAFWTFPLETWTARLDVEVYVHERPGDLAAEGRMTLLTEPGDETYKAGIHLLAPSRHGKEGTTAAGGPYGDAYFHKSIVHEYAAVFLDLATRAKVNGWTFFEAPGWFREGYPEYLGVTRSTAYSRETTLGAYLKAVKADPGRVKLVRAGRETRIEVQDTCADGAVLLLFLHETFKREKVQAVLRSEADDFGEALCATLGVRWEGLYERYLAWVEKKGD